MVKFIVIFCMLFRVIIAQHVLYDSFLVDLSLNGVFPINIKSLSASSVKEIPLDIIKVQCLNMRSQDNNIAYFSYSGYAVNLCLGQTFSVSFANQTATFIVPGDPYYSIT